MADFVPVGKVGDIEDGELAAFEVEGVPVAVANVEGLFYAFDDTCTHRACSLSEGDVEGTRVICPCHGGEFDMETGEAAGGPVTEPIQVYETRVVDDTIEVLVDN